MLSNPLRNGRVLDSRFTGSITLSTVNLFFVSEDFNIEIGDRIEADVWFTIFNNSGASRAYNFFTGVTLPVQFNIEFINTFVNSAVNRQMIHLKSIVDIRANNLAYQVARADSFTSAGLASGGGSSMLATRLQGVGWQTSTSDFTGAQNSFFTIRSNAVNAGQTVTLHNMTTRIYRTQL